MKAVPFMEKVEKTLRGLYIYYHSSTKRSSQLKEVAAALQMQLLKLKDINAVRWVASKEQALQAFLKSRQAVVFQLQKNSNVGTFDIQKAKVFISILFYLYIAKSHFLKAICNFRFLKYCHFLYDVLLHFKEKI